MREYEYEIEEHFQNGLRPDESNPTNGPYLVELWNARPSTLGLKPYEATVLPYNSEQSYYITDHRVIWPFPQVFFTKKYRFVGTKATMYQVTNGILTSLFGYDSEERWDLADFSDYIVAAKDRTKLMVRSISGGWGDTTAMPKAGTVENMNGQLFLGNLASWSSWTDLTERYLAWSDIGSAAFTLDRRNEAGFREHDFTGPVVEVKKLGNLCVVYGYNGISVFRPVVEPAPTYAYKNIASIGIYNKGAVAGDDKEHCFVGSDGHIYKINEQLEVARSGYQEFILELDNGTVVVLHDPGEGDYYFSDGVRSFILTPKGMCEIFQRISTLTRYNGVKYGVSSDATDTTFLAVTDRMDFGLRGRKTVECIELSASGDGDFSVAIDWRNGPSEVFTRSDWAPVNDQGVATIRISATEFRFAVKCSDYSDAFLSSAKVRFKMEDMKSIRGVYSPPPRGQRVG